MNNLEENYQKAINFSKEYDKIRGKILEKASELLKQMESNSFKCKKFFELESLTETVSELRARYELL
jgi:hypothetical protein